MNCDKNSRGRYMLTDITENEFETLRRALKSHRAGLLNKIPGATEGVISEAEEQYINAGKMLQQLETL
ncbi:MAG: hypothetical protein RRY23_00030 [Alistipes sp.]